MMRCASTGRNEFNSSSRSRPASRIRRSSSRAALVSSQELLQFPLRRRAFRHRELEGQVVDDPAELAEQSITAFEIALEGIQSLVEPARQHLLRAVGEIRHVDLDVLGLANPIEPSDALFQEFGVQRQIEQDEVVRELEIASFAADLRTDQQPRPVGLGKPGGVAIPLHQGETLVEESRLDGNVPP